MITAWSGDKFSYSVHYCRIAPVAAVDTAHLIDVGELAHPRAMMREWPLSKDAFDIGVRELIADVEEAAGRVLRHGVGEAVSEIQTRRVHASSPLFVGFPNPTRRGCGNRHDVEVRPGQEVRHPRPDPAPG